MTCAACHRPIVAHQRSDRHSLTEKDVRELADRGLDFDRTDEFHAECCPICHRDTGSP